MSEPYSRHSVQSLALAILVEFALLAVAAVVLARATVARPMTEPTPIVLAKEEAEVTKRPKPEPPKPKLAPSKPSPKQVVPPPPMPQPPLPEPVKATPLPAPVVASPTAFTEPAPPPVPPPPPAPSPDAVRQSADYAARVRAAVQAAHYYPPAAAALRYSGRVRVEFHLRDALPSEARLLSPSGIGIIDRAALDAVQRAQYPVPPSALKGAELVYEVWVEFYR
jgi:protein TonB